MQDLAKKIQRLQDLLKAAKRRPDANKIAEMLRLAAVAQNEKSTPEQKLEARKNAIALLGDKTIQEPPELPQEKPEKGLLSPKIQENVQNQVKELDRKKIAENVVPIKSKTRQIKKEQKSDVDKLLNNINDLHDGATHLRNEGDELFKDGKVSDAQKKFDFADKLHHQAFEAWHSIPAEHIPTELKNYHPAFMYYGTSPKAFANSVSKVPEFADDMHQYHQDVLSGKHSETNHSGTKAYLTKIKTPKNPTNT